MSDPAIPRGAERALEALGAETDFRDAVLGDLAEEFLIRATWDGVPEARRWYYKETIRVAPHFIRNWLGQLRARTIAGLFGTLGASAAATFVFEVVIVRILAPALDIPIDGMLIDVSPHSPLGAIALSASLLVWTASDGVVAGYVAARVGRRAPLASALVCAASWGAVMLWGNFIVFHGSASLSYRVLNILAMIGGVAIGGLVALNRRRTSIRVF
jgi:hypothetical protein